MDNGANYNRFNGCIINSPISTSSSVSALYSSTANDNYNIFSNNSFRGGYYTVYWRGTSTSSFDKGNQFLNNIITDFYYYGNYFYYQDSLIFNGNYITEGNNGSYAYYPAYFYYCDNYLEIGNNKLDLSPVNYSYGLRIYYSDCISSSRGRIYNNAISITSGTGTSYGIYLYSSNYVDVVFNSVNITSGGTSTRGFYTSSGGNNRFVNNNIVSTVGQTMYVSGTPFTTSDRNNYYTGTSSIAVNWSGVTYTTVAALTASTMMDANSVSTDPSYYSATDLHAANPMLAVGGTPIANVTTDMDGDVRSAVSPSIGADEFASLQWDINTYALTQPAMTYGAVSLQDTVSVVYRNFGSDTITAMTLGYQYGNNAAVNVSWTGSLLPG